MEQTKLVVLFWKPKQQTACWLAFTVHPEEGFFASDPAQEKNWWASSGEINKKANARLQKKYLKETIQKQKFLLFICFSRIGLFSIPCWKISLWINGMDISSLLSGASHAPAVFSSPLSPTLSKLISAVLLAGDAIWPLLATLERHLRTGLKSGGILLKTQLWCPGLLPPLPIHDWNLWPYSFISAFLELISAAFHPTASLWLTTHGPTLIHQQ